MSLHQERSILVMPRMDSKRQPYVNTEYLAYLTGLILIDLILDLGLLGSIPCIFWSGHYDTYQYSSAYYSYRSTFNFYLGSGKYHSLREMVIVSSCGGWR